MISDPEKPDFSLGAMRRQYGEVGLSFGDLHAEPWLELAAWIKQANSAGLVEPNAMVLATADPGGRPSVRTVLLKHLDEEGLVWFTHYHSQKGLEIRSNSQASVCFSWPALERQIRVAGRAERLSEGENDAYWQSRPRLSQLGSAASPQGEIIPGREWLEKRFQELAQKYPDRVPRPADWGGFRLRPDWWEFWQGGPNRLHDRMVYQNHSADGWQQIRLAP